MTTNIQSLGSYIWAVSNILREDFIKFKTKREDNWIKSGNASGEYVTVKIEG